MPDWSHLHLSAWPFQMLPDETFASIWADRAELKNTVDRLLWRWSRVERSTVHLMWANLGAGKTHTLRHIQARCLAQGETSFLPVYLLVPMYVRSFLQVYQAIASAVDLKAIAALFARKGGRADRSQTARELFPSVPDAVTALHILADGSELQKDIAAAWLQGARGLTRHQLDTIGVTRQLRTSDDAVTLLAGLVRIVNSLSDRRVLVMLDECQRIGSFRPAIGLEISAGLRTWFNLNPNHLTLILSFGTGEERYVRHLLSPELQTIADYRTLRLDLLSEDAAFEFVNDLLSAFRTPGSPTAYFPFTPEVIQAVVRRLCSDGGATPRLLMKVFDALLSEADYALASKHGLKIDEDLAVMLAEEARAELQRESKE